MNREKEKISIKQIAELAKVSVATVSRVINQKGRFSSETEKKVLDIIERYNYKPSMIARGLRTNESKTVGIIMPDITNEFFSSIVRELEIQLFSLGYTAFICNTDESEETEKKYYWDLLSKAVDGFICISGRVKNEQDFDLAPTVFIDREIQNNDKSIVVASDNYEGGYLATSEMIRSGCKKIAILMDKRSISTSNDRYSGYKKALKKFGIELDKKLVRKVYPINYSTAKSEVEKMIKEKIEFDGIFAITDWMALGVTDALRNEGYKVPQNVKVVGFDNISISKFSSLPITTISQNVELLAQKSVELLMDLIAGEKVQRKTYIIPVSLVKRESC